RDPRGIDEAGAMARYLEARAIPAEAILEDHAGNTTWLTAVHTRELLGAKHLDRVIAVSQYFHLRRCRLALAKQGLHAIYWSHARYWEWRDLYSIPRELVALLKYAFYPAARPRARVMLFDGIARSRCVTRLNP